MAGVRERAPSRLKVGGLYTAAAADAVIRDASSKIINGAINALTKPFEDLSNAFPDAGKAISNFFGQRLTLTATLPNAAEAVAKAAGEEATRRAAQEEVWLRAKAGAEAEAEAE